VPWLNSDTHAHSQSLRSAAVTSTFMATPSAQKEDGWDLDEEGWDDTVESFAPGEESASAPAVAAPSAVAPTARPAVRSAAPPATTPAVPKGAARPTPAADRPAAPAAAPAAAAAPLAASPPVPQAADAQQQQQQPPHPSTSTTTTGTLLSGWGLPSGLGGLAHIGTKLQDAARAAAKETKQLAETLQQGLAEATADPESEVERLARYQAPPEPGEPRSRAPDAAPSTAAIGRGAPATPPGVVRAARGQGVGGGDGSEGPEEAARRRSEVLRRLEGEERGVAAGLKVGVALRDEVWGGLAVGTMGMMGCELRVKWKVCVWGWYLLRVA